MPGLQRTNLAAEGRPFVQTRNRETLIAIGKWAFLCAGTLGAFFSFATWFLVPGVVDLNRILAAGLYVSLATNAFLVSGVLFYASTDDGAHVLAPVIKTPPIVMSGLLLLAFTLVAATVPWWARR